MWFMRAVADGRTVSLLQQWTEPDGDSELLGSKDMQLRTRGSRFGLFGLLEALFHR